VASLKLLSHEYKIWKRERWSKKVKHSPLQKASFSENKEKL
jgi:hypothetical protein